MNISELRSKKPELVEKFREHAHNTISAANTSDPKKLAGVSNKAHSDLLALELSKLDAASKEDRPYESLLVHYCYILSMLETRQRVWAYDYMAFSRRIGEIWELFCANCWENPLATTSIIQPPKISELHGKVGMEIKNLNLEGDAAEVVNRTIGTLSGLLGRINLRACRV